MARPDVLSRLAEGGSYPIVLLRAPAGAGKTSVLRLLPARKAEAAPVALAHAGPCRPRSGPFAVEPARGPAG
jgi:replication-associated recombination protein RarA